MMIADIQRNILIIAFVVTSLIAWQTWKTDKSIQSKQILPSSSNYFYKKSLMTNRAKFLTVSNNVLKATINLQGGNIEQAELLSYPEKLNSKKPFCLLNTNKNFLYQAQSGFMEAYNISKNLNPLYQISEKSNFFRTSSIDGIKKVFLRYLDHKGNVFFKVFTMRMNDYFIKVDFYVKNNTKRTLKIITFNQLRQSVHSHHKNGSKSFSLRTFRGAAYSTVENNYKKYNFSTILNDSNLNIRNRGGWIAMLQQYFATAWIPKKNSENYFYTANLGQDIVAIGYKSKIFPIKKNDFNKVNSSTLWIGPEIQDKMALVAPNLDLTVDYGWLWFISQPLFKLLKFINQFLGNWGFSIVIITFIVRGVMYPLNKAQYTSMAKTRVLQPKIEDIRKRFIGDKKRISQEIMNIYKNEKVNPLGGCLPVIIQMPIFLALYYMLIGSVELRNAPFIFWIHDLSSQDPYYILPILMGVTMLMIQKISPNTITDPTQRKIMYFTPLLFTLFFLWFPAGLVLYYIVSNLVTILQQQLINRGLKNHGVYK